MGDRVRCPGCGVAVDVHNLPEHIEKAHHQDAGLVDRAKLIRKNPNDKTLLPEVHKPERQGTRKRGKLAIDTPSTDALSHRVSGSFESGKRR